VIINYHYLLKSTLDYLSQHHSIQTSHQIIFMSNKEKIFFEVRNLTKIFRPVGLYGKTEVIKALNNVSFSVSLGQTMGIVGESGSGKSTIGRCVLGLTELSSGEIILGGEQINYKRKKDIKNFRRKIQIVFQNPQRSFNPVYNIRTSVGESLNVRPEWSRKQRLQRIEEVLDAVKINEELRNRRPEQLSGGQLQRVAIARAIAPEPNLIFLDEPTSSLDLSVRSEVLSLLNELQKTLNITYVFVSHDLEVVRAITNNIIVMYRGQIVEKGSSEVLFKNPSHPYTQALLAASEF
jgi:ABC-type oligopeptide transport system ATPase subunit